MVVRRRKGPGLNVRRCAHCKLVKLKTDDVVGEVVEVQVILKFRSINYRGKGESKDTDGANLVISCGKYDHKAMSPSTMCDVLVINTYQTDLET
jgi:hypothetical protein